MTTIMTPHETDGEIDGKVLLSILIAFRRGDFSARMPGDWIGLPGKIADTLNQIIEISERTTRDVERVAQVVGKAGKVDARMAITDLQGSWVRLADANNTLIDDLLAPMNEMVRVISAVSAGDLSQRVPVEIDGRTLAGQFSKSVELVNTTMERLNTFTSEVTRVAREVGIQGKLGGQAAVPGATGTWRDLTDSVNSMAANLTGQVRGIAKVVTAVANGDLKQRLTLEAKGEIAELADTINGMTETLGLFADQVTSVAREVGVEGRLGGQAAVPGAAGIWRDLADNVNQLAANLTSQVRAIAGVATAVTKGDLSCSVTVEACGEVSELKDNVNEMICNLRETTRQNAEQDWLKTNLTRFTCVLQGQRDLATVSRAVLSELAPLVNAHHGVFYSLIESADGVDRLRMLSAYAYKERKHLSTEWKIGEGLVGQCAYEKQRILLTNVPGDYVQITSGLGEAKPLNIVILPILFEGKVKAVIELASFERYSAIHQAFLDQLAESIGVIINTVEVNARTEDLLQQSQSLAQELQGQQEQLRQTNDELEVKARLLEEQKMEVESKSREIKQAKAAVEEKAAQLALTSKYKSEFLSNMSHELRTPLNSLLILAQQLANNPQGHLDAQEIEFAQTIRSSGNDLLSLINEILDLSKIESGTVSLDLSAVAFASLRDQIERTFRHVAQNKGLGFDMILASDLPANIVTDEKRLLQVLKNLLSNAFKFTEKGQVTVRVTHATSGWSPGNDRLNRAAEVFAFSVEDTGLSIPDDKQHIIFEAFQQADGGTARKFGGTGLGLSISREIAKLLGGELRLAHSATGQGSLFVLYMPQNGGGSGRQEAAAWAGLAGARSLIEGHAADSALPPFRAGESEDDRAGIRPGDRVLLIIDDDAAFTKTVLGVAHDKGFKGVIARRGSQSLELARQFKPDAITLDIRLPDMDGWAVLDVLKQDPELRHIPVAVITALDEPLRGFSRGAFQFLTKPVSRNQLNGVLDVTRKFLDRSLKSLLLVAADKNEQKEITELLGYADLAIQAVASGKAGLAALRKKPFDCVVLEMKLVDMSAADFIAILRKDEALARLPVVVYSRQPLGDAERAELKQLANTDVVKSVESPEQLLDQTALFLHCVLSSLPEEKRRLLRQLQEASHNLAGKKVLIVDDDVRNLFALTAALERKGMVVLSVENGRAAIDALEQNPDIDLVLMDIMMPDMDGHETIRNIRKLAKFKKLPIIALTAKAMVGDREKCLEAGASDYLSKPVNIEQLSSLMQVCLSR